MMDPYAKMITPSGMKYIIVMDNQLLALSILGIQIVAHWWKMGKCGWVSSRKTMLCKIAQSTINIFSSK